MKDEIIKILGGTISMTFSGNVQRVWINQFRFKRVFLNPCFSKYSKQLILHSLTDPIYYKLSSSTLQTYVKARDNK